MAARVKGEEGLAEISSRQGRVTGLPAGAPGGELPVSGPKAGREAAPQVRVEVIDNLDDLAALQTEWDALLLRQARPVPMSSYAWLSAYFEYLLMPDQRWLCLVAKLSGRLVGVLPLVVTARTKWKRPYSLYSAPYDSHTYSVDMTVAPECTEAVVAAFLKALSDIDPRWSVLHMIRLAADSPALACIPNGLGQVGAIHELCDPESILSTEGPFDAYLAGLSFNFRRLLRRSRRKLESLQDVSFSVQTDGSLTEALKRLLAVEGMSWRSESGEDLGSQPALLKAHLAVAERMQEGGPMRFYFLDIGGVTVAAQMAFQYRSTLIIKKVVFREDYAEVSPGNLLFEWVLRQAFEDPQTRLVNCLTDMPWHDRWKMEKRPNYHLIAYNRRALPLLSGYLPRRVKQLAHHIPGLAPFYRWSQDRRA